VFRFIPDWRPRGIVEAALLWWNRRMDLRAPGAGVGEPLRAPEHLAASIRERITQALKAADAALLAALSPAAADSSHEGGAPQLRINGGAHLDRTPLEPVAQSMLQVSGPEKAAASEKLNLRPAPVVQQMERAADEVTRPGGEHPLNFSTLETPPDQLAAASRLPATARFAPRAAAPLAASIPARITQTLRAPDAALLAALSPAAVDFSHEGGAQQIQMDGIAHPDRTPPQRLAQPALQASGPEQAAASEKLNSKPAPFVRQIERVADEVTRPAGEGEWLQPPAPDAAPRVWAAGQRAAAPLETPRDQLSPLGIARVQYILERRLAPEQASHVQVLERAAISAASKGFAASALEKAVELARLAPERAEALIREPAFSALRSELETALHRLIPAAKLDAQTHVAEAVQALIATPPDPAPPGMVDARSILAEAQRNLEEGGLVQFRMAAHLAQAVIDHYAALALARPAARVPEPVITRIKTARGRRPTEVREMTARIVRRLTERVAALWFRGPLFILLAGWLVLGVACAAVYHALRAIEPEIAGSILVEIGFDAWGLGFLALVGLGFYMRVRHVKFPSAS
jgi:hypothetical protein